jgi:RNA polymerase sigma factor (sigma-70 family)
MMWRDPLADPEPLIRRVHSYVAYRIGSGPDAEDVTNDTLERAVRARKTYDPAKGTPVAWLLGIARRCVAEATQPRPLPLAEPPEAVGPGHEEASVRRLTLSAALAALDERDQELIALRYGADLTARRIGEVLGLKTNAVEVALHRALGRLRELLEEPGPSGKETTSSARIGGDEAVESGRHDETALEA